MTYRTLSRHKTEVRFPRSNGVNRTNFADGIVCVLYLETHPIKKQIVARKSIHSLVIVARKETGQNVVETILTTD